MSGYLLDTHAAIWWWTSDSRLGRGAADVIAANAEPIHLSAASVWEVAIKSSIGKLPEIVDFENEYEPLMRANHFIRLTITDDHALRSGFLRGPHRDPFDRLIAAQALIENMTVITRDPAIAGFGCKVLW